MMQLGKRILVLALLTASLVNTHAFSLLGPPKPWQLAGFGGRPQGLGYSLQFDIGAPMTPLEGYRWNIPIITYGFDATFVRYFGTNGVNAVEEAIKVLNDLPAASKMTESLTEFPTDTVAENQTAGLLGLLDVKSAALAMLMEELGLAQAERYVWGLRDRKTPQGQTNYTVVNMNYDPVTLQPSRYVNGVLYNYRIFDDLGPLGNEWASAVEWYQLDPLYRPHSSVAGGFNNADAELGSSPDAFTFLGSGLAQGQFYRGLTRDDVGGLRYLLSTNNLVTESLLLDVFPSAKFATSVSPWSPYPIFGTNGVGTNTTGVTNGVGSLNLTNFVRVAVRPGRDKLSFKRVNYDSLLSSTFTPITNRFRDTYLDPKTGRLRSQQVERVIFQPDILFAMGDLGTEPISGIPFLYDRTTTAGWSNNVALNSPFAGNGLGGPGVITPGVQIRFTDLVPYFLNDVPGDLEVDGVLGFVWGSFDGSTKLPIVYPSFPNDSSPQITLQYLQAIALRRNTIN